MPQRCRGLEDPAGGAPRPCIFAADGDGGPAPIRHRRDGLRCAFCCPDAFDRACGARVGKGHITKRLKQWHAQGSPSYEAAFTFGLPGLLLSDEKQRDLRRRAGERPYFDVNTSWLHKKRSRLEAFKFGKPIMQAPALSHAAQCFLQECTKHRTWTKHKMNAWVRAIRAPVRQYSKIRQEERLPRRVSKKRRQEWWRLRRVVQMRLLPALAAGSPFPAAVAWARDEGIVAVQAGALFSSL